MDAEFAEFVSARYAHLCRSAYLLVGDAASAEDLVQEALLRVLAAYRRGRIEELEAYTRAAIVNLSVSGWRRQARGSALLGKWSVGAGPHRADPTIAVDLHEALWGGRSG